MENNKIRIAFVKFGGLSAGGTERWLQMMAANLPRENFEVDFYYCDAAPYVGSDYKHADTDQDRLRYLREHDINLIRFKVGAKDITKKTHDWVDTDFWNIFTENKYDIIQTAKGGEAEYPYTLMKKPVVECITLPGGPDKSDNIAWSIHLSEWQRSNWFRNGGNLQKSSVIPIPVEKPASAEDLRKELDIPAGAIVAGFHQRADDNIMSPIPLAAFARLENPERYFAIMGGGNKYREQAKKLNLKNVRFLDHSGDAEKISKFLNTLDIFAHGRRDGETFGAVLAEAMMHGLPCLSHWSPIANAQPETMGPGGLFALNKKDYARKLRSFFTDQPLRKKLSAKSRAHAEEYYSMKSAVNELENIYCRILGRWEMNENMKIPYGYSRMKFLYAGPIENPDSLAHCIALDIIPEEFELMIAKHFLPRTKTFLDIGANIGLYCFIAARHCPENANISAFEPQPDNLRFLNKTIYLNNWEDRIRVLSPGFSDVAGKADFLKIDTENTSKIMADDSLGISQSCQPVIFIKTADRIKGLLEKKYSVYRLAENFRLIKTTKAGETDRSCWYLCLPPGKTLKNIFSLRIKAFFFQIAKNSSWLRITKRIKPILKSRLPRGIVILIKKMKKYV